VVPDHTFVSISTESPSEAHFLCALLNSSTVQYIVQAYIALHPSPHVMKYLPLPRFDPANKFHKVLAAVQCCT
jgi:hypothetical protein